MASNANADPDSGAADIFISAVAAEAGEAARALEDALCERGMSVFRAHGSQGGNEDDELSACSMAVILGTASFGLGASNSTGNETAKHLRFIMSKRKPFFFVKMCDAFEAPEAAFCLPDDAAHFRWAADTGPDHVNVPAGLADAIQQELKSQFGWQAGAPGAAVYDLGDAAEEELGSATRDYEQPKPSLLEDPHGYDNVIAHTRHANASTKNAGLQLRDEEDCYETILDADNNLKFPPLNPQRDQVQKAWARLNHHHHHNNNNNNNNSHNSATDVHLPGQAQEGPEIPLRRLSSRNSDTSKMNAPMLPQRMSSTLQTFDTSTKSAPRASAATGGLNTRSLFLVVVIAFLVAAATTTAAILIYDSMASEGTGTTGGSASSGQASSNTTTLSPTTLIPAPPGPCLTTTTATLNCGELTSKNDFTTSNACDAGAVLDCCCEEFYRLQSITASVTLFSIVDVLRFGAITAVGGDIIGSGRQLTTVDFQRLAYVGGDIDLRSNTLTAIDFKGLTQVRGDVLLNGNSLTHVNLNSLTSVGDVLLAQNSITRVDARALRRIRGHFDLRRNNLDTLNAGALTRIDRGLKLVGSGMSNLSIPSLTFMNGTLLADNGKLRVVDLGSLTLSGGIRLSNNELTRVNFGRLRTCDWHLDLSNNLLRSVSLPSLSFVELSLNLGRNELTELDLSALANVTSDVVLSGNRLSSVSLPSLSMIARGLRIENDGPDDAGNPLTSVHAGALTWAGWVDLTSENLESVDFHELTYLKWSFNLYSTKVTSLSLPKLTYAGTRLKLNNNRLTHVNLESLREVSGDIDLSHNRLTNFTLPPTIQAIRRLYLNDNELTALDCRGVVSSCVCVDSNVVKTRCPRSCC